MKSVTAVTASVATSCAVQIADCSRSPRAGAKGPGAARWLQALGIDTPAAANQWLPLSGGGLIARLGNSEFLIEGNATAVEKILAAPRTEGVYPVLRQDASFVVSGAEANELWLQTCAVDFRLLDAAPASLLMTNMVGVAVTVIATATGTDPTYRLWCDGTYGEYLWETLSGIVDELGGTTGSAIADTSDLSFTHPLSKPFVETRHETR